MKIYNNLYCKIFVDVDAEYEMDNLIDKINKLLSGEKKLFRTLVTQFGEIDINKNEDFDVERRKNTYDGFLYSRYYLDIEPNMHIDPKDYIASISSFLEKLWELGFNATAACDFEEELPSITNNLNK